MHLCHWTLLTLLLFLINGCDSKFGGGARGGFGGARGGFGGRGASAARSSSIFGGKSSGGFSSRSYGGSFKSGAGRSSYRTRTIGGASYYVPSSGMRSRDTFRSSFRSSFMGGMLGGYMIGRAMSPMRVNGYDYYYGQRYYSGARDRQICSAKINQIDSNNVPFDTSLSSNNKLDEQMEMNKIDEELVVDNSTDIINSTTTNDEFKFADLTFEDGSKPDEIVWSCPTAQDRCCYMECCPLSEDDEDRRMVGYALIGLFILILITLWASNRRSQHGPIRR